MKKLFVCMGNAGRSHNHPKGQNIEKIRDEIRVKVEKLSKDIGS